MGGGARYQSAASTGFNVNADGSISKYYSTDLLIADFRTGYTTVLTGKRKPSVTVNLNVRNVFDEDDYRVISTRADGSPARGIFQSPRTFLLSTTVTF